MAEFHTKKILYDIILSHSGHVAKTFLVCYYLWAMLTKKQKDNIIKKFQTHKGDTGSPEVQVDRLTREIDEVSGHLKEHKKDNHSRRGLLKMVGNRRRLMRYLKGEDERRYERLATKLKLKK